MSTGQVGVGVEKVVEVVSSQYGPLDGNRVRINLIDILDRRDRCIPAEPIRTVTRSLEIWPRVRQRCLASCFFFGLLAFGFLARPTPFRLFNWYIQDMDYARLLPPAIESPEALHQGGPRAQLSHQQIRIEANAGFENLGTDHLTRRNSSWARTTRLTITKTNRPPDATHRS